MEVRLTFSTCFPLKAINLQFIINNMRLKSSKVGRDKQKFLAQRLKRKAEFKAVLQFWGLKKWSSSERVLDEI